MELFIGLVLGGVVSLLVNLVTPPVQRWWATTSERRRQRRITRLERLVEQLRYRRLMEYRQEAIINAFRYLVLSLAVIGIAVFSVYQEVLMVHSEISKVGRVFPKMLSLRMSDVTFYRMRILTSLFSSVFVTYTITQAFVFLGRSSPFHVKWKVESAIRELQSLKRPVDKPGEDDLNPIKPQD
jgi:hypothetical protein